jgi:hypothetical protein
VGSDMTFLSATARRTSSAVVLALGLGILGRTGVCMAQTDLVHQAPWLHPTCNSEADDYAPSADLDPGAMLFTSERSGVAQVYRCDSDGTVLLVPGTLNQPGRARGFVSLPPGGSGLATSYRMGKRQSYASIISVLRTASSLDEGLPLETAAGDFFVAQASIAPDQSRMMFVSDREGGLGGTDLWMMERRIDGTWSEPQHGGDAINSPSNELTPILIATDTLLFASDGMGGIGGQDIYMSVARGGRWSDPVPVTALNSVWNETDATRMHDGSYRISSDRPGGRGGYDIWIWKPELGD